MNSVEFEYDVVISFAGEDRAIAERFAELLKAEGFSVFYDFWNKADLWGRNLYQHLAEIYSKKGRYCVMFLSAAYAAKAWTKHEMKAAQERAFRENEEYILPVRRDDTSIPGIGETIGYLDLRRDSIEEVAKVAVEKINRTTSRGTATQAQTSRSLLTEAKKPAGRSSNLKLKKQFTEQDHDTFLEDAYEVIAKYFEESLAGLAAENLGIVGKFRRINANDFTAIIYQNGKNVTQCAIRLGGGFGKMIVYSNNPNSTNSMNEGVSVVDDGDTMFLKATENSSIFHGKQQKKQLNPLDAAEMFWSLLLAPLQR